MINPRLIKKRVRSIKNIGKITKALEMVSASKIQKLTDKALNAKPYARVIYELIEALAGDSESSAVPLMKQSKKVINDLYILITTNRGLVGSLNTNLFKNTSVFLGGRSTNHKFITIGKKGRPYTVSNGMLEADFSETGNVGNIVSSINKIIVSGFLDGIYDEVYIVYNDFITLLTQEPAIKRILPIKKEEVSKKQGKFEVVGKKVELGDSMHKTASFFYEPDPITVLGNVLPYYLEVELTEAFYEAEASEHAARMIAMKVASDNASELSDNLSFEYNKARQSMITTEISDITTAQSSLNKS